MEFPQATMTAYFHASRAKDDDVLHEVYEGEIPNMSQEQQDQLKALLGDGQARVTVSREISDTDYGKGGKVFMAITLTCDQSQAGVTAAAGWAQSMVDYFVSSQYEEFRQRLIAMHLIAPRSTP